MKKRKEERGGVLRPGFVPFQILVSLVALTKPQQWVVFSLILQEKSPKMEIVNYLLLLLCS